MKTMPTKEEREQVRILLTKVSESELITEWEGEEFLPSLQTQTFWSQKQRDILEAIWLKVME